jgi:hypothetical protein
MLEEQLTLLEQALDQVSPRTKTLLRLVISFAPYAARGRTVSSSS